MTRRPCIWTIPSSRKSLYVADVVSDESQHRAAFQLISDAAQRADNVGLDEFTPDALSRTLNKADVAISLNELPTGSSGSPGRLLALMVVTQSRFSRSVNPPNCLLTIVTTNELGGRQTRRDLVHLGTTLVAEARRPYTGCMVEVFVTCLEHVLALRDEGFYITACVPEAGILSGQPGYVDSYIMYKKLVHTRVVGLVLNDAGENPEKMDFMLRELPDCQPYCWNIDEGGTRMIVRPLRRDEVGDNYAAIQEAMAVGRGFGCDEYPTISHFIKRRVDGDYNIVFELETSKERRCRAVEVGSSGSRKKRDVEKSVVCYINVGPSVHTRRQRHNSVIGTMAVLMLPEFQRRRWSSKILRVVLEIMADCGFHYLVSKVALTNLAAFWMLRSGGVFVCGTIPHGMYLRNQGWVDQYVFAAPLKPRDLLQARQMRMSKI